MVLVTFVGVLLLNLPHSRYPNQNPSPLLDPSHNRPKKKQLLQKEKGFTLIEIMVVIVIVGILASIAMGILIDARERACVGSIKSDLSNAYKISIAFYAESPDDEIDLDILNAKGFVQSEGVVLTVVDGNWDALSITGTHPNVVAIYELDMTGQIFKQ